MPRYLYTVKTKPTTYIEGKIEAESEQDAISKLARMGYLPLSLNPEDLSLGREGMFGFRKIPKKDLALFTHQLSNLIESGINILNGLNIISHQMPNKHFKLIIDDLMEKIKDGKSLSESMKAHPAVFSNFYTSMIHSGEAGGTLEQSLARLSEFLQKEEEFLNSIRAALTYPAFIFAVSILTVVVLLGFVIPRLVGMFEDLGQILPLPTKILIGLSGFLRSFWWLILAFLATGIFSLKRFASIPQGKMALDTLALKLPAAGGIFLKTELSRFLRTLALLLSGGMPIIQSLDIAKSVLTNEAIKLQINAMKDQISGGMSLSAYLKRAPLFPEYMTNIISIGEETGTLERSLLRIADEYENEVDRQMKAMTRLLEPVIILVMGLVVGFIVVSMLLPIFQINLIVR